MKGRNYEVRILNLRTFYDDRGGLVSIESSSDIPFEIRRVYYIFSNERGLPRGHHAHKKLKQVLICVSGSVEVVCTTADSTERFVLDKPNNGLLIEGLVWRVMENFSKGSVLLVLASEHYQEKDYIRDKSEFELLSGMNTNEE